MSGFDGPEARYFDSLPNFDIVRSKELTCKHGRVVVGAWFFDQMYGNLYSFIVPGTGAVTLALKVVVTGETFGLDFGPDWGRFWTPRRGRRD